MTRGLYTFYPLFEVQKRFSMVFFLKIMASSMVYKQFKSNSLIEWVYRMRTIVTRGLYTFYPLFDVQKRFSRDFFLKILALCMVSIQERFQIKSGLWWRVYGK